jgi:quercetin dioxygenase-like cupin family protein
MTDSAAPAPMVLLPGSGEQLPFIGTLRASAAETGGAFEVIEFTGPAVPPAHVHREHEEVFLVQTGSFRFTLGDEVADAPAGSIVVVPRGARHAFTIEPGSTALLLIIPSGLGGYFAELGAGLAEGRSGQQIRASLAGKYDSYPDPSV